MATLALAAAGAAIGSAALPTGLSVLGATISGATIGTQIGALAGRVVDQSLFGASGRQRHVDGPRLSSVQVMTSSEGAPIPRLYGRARLGGQVIWARDFEEVATSSEQASGQSKGFGSTGGGTTRTEYAYYATFAVAIAEGELTSLGRVFADGQELALDDLTWRFHAGSETQAADPAIIAHEGAESAPAFRGVAYVVFERLPLADFGNRLPQLSFEAARSLDQVPKLARAVVLIPASGEFVYAQEPVSRTGYAGEQIAENVHTRRATTDWAASLDQLEAELPAVRSVSLTVAWFGTDLRAGHCQIRPAVDRREKVTAPLAWSVAGLDRSSAAVVSEIDGRAAYGGTPSDDTVVAALHDLTGRGLAATLTPFLLMDVPGNSGQTDPYTGAASQPAYPWRGRITLDPAAGRPGSPDKTAAATTQLAAFVGQASLGDFSIAEGRVVYSGPAEWSYRRFILHYAHLAKLAGGVDAFIIGSEMRGLTTARSASSVYPFVTALVALGRDVKALLGAGVKVTYAADWSEYFGHQPADGSGDVRYHLDPLWADPAIDAVGIDAYFPLTDWRDGRDHADAREGARSIYDLGYLKSRLTGGEGYDWFYASEADRDAQVRTPITDGLGKPWVYRPKDLANWWGNLHRDRTGGVEAQFPSAWLPGLKPIWLTEVGSGAIDKGSNQPNLFTDPKSGEDGRPYASSGARDDLIQRRLIQAYLEAFDPTHPGHVPALVPVSTVYGGPMVDPRRIYLYSWDARPFPAFPADSLAWGDAGSWSVGHWLTGRLAGVTLSDATRQILLDHGFEHHDTSALVGMVPGLVVDRILSARETLQPLELAYFFDSVESGGLIRFVPRGAEPDGAPLSLDDLVETRPEAALVTRIRRQETDLPLAAKITYLSSANDYAAAVAEARRSAGQSQRVAQAELPLVLDPDQAIRIAESWLFESWAARDTARLTLPPSGLRFEPGDVVSVDAGTGARLYRITEIGDHTARDLSLMSIDPAVYDAPVAPSRPAAPAPVVAVGPPSVELLELPVLNGGGDGLVMHVAASQSPWRGPVAIYSSPADTGFELAGIANRSATLGVTLDPLPRGPVSRFDRASRVRVVMAPGSLSSVTTLQLFSGSNAFAVAVPGGGFEILQAERAELVAPGTYQLSALLRGQAGTEHLIAHEVPPGTRIVLIDSSLAELSFGTDRLGLPLNWRVGPASAAIGSPDYVSRTLALGGIRLRPLAPVHIRGRRDGVGDLAIDFVRRSRIAGDSWDLVDPPLGETEEVYEIDILDGPVVRRTIRTTAPSATYPAADQIADFGSLPVQVSVRVAQLSSAVGRGIAASAEL